MTTLFILGQLFGGQLFELFARETNLKKQSSVRRTGGAPALRHLDTKLGETPNLSALSLKY